ncbi:unnamed protein product [Bemisia tabaci]|uniref:Conserved oligomeric Golgi complex subunit 2 n=1 Tax=Bemisia tabaci TaxID=7038 RepID=A0A9P0AGH7_BEMTA|nr:unnamed protein product [Bemisia tabaci]
MHLLIMSSSHLSADLCFNHNDFIQDSFSVDQFLQDHRKKANLEMMRDDLGIYLKILRSSMIELINQDYADFVNLSSNLIALDKSISTIQEPLETLSSKILETKFVLDKTIEDIEALVGKKKCLAAKKESLRNFSKMQNAAYKLEKLLNTENLSTILLTRAATEYSWLNCYSKKCQSHITKDFQQLQDKISDSLLSHLNRLFLEAFKNGESQLDVLKISLNLFVTLGKSDVVENLIRTQIVSPAMDKLISEDSLLSDPCGLEGLYSRVVAFIDNDLKYILQLTRPTKDPPIIKGFNIMCNSVWPEVDQCLELRLKTIYAPGNPDVFHQRYSETMHFLNELEHRCGNEGTVKALRSQSQYQAFLQKWNLSVYFQLRFQQIATQLENLLIDREKYTTIISTSRSPHLTVTNTVWLCINQCWAPNIFIMELAHRFWKLSLQIISRFCSWITSALKETALPSASLSNSQFQSYLYSDCEFLISSLPELQDLAKLKLVDQTSEEVLILINSSIADTEDLLKACLVQISKSVIEEIAELSLPHVRSVSDTPRLFRRTNRENPKSPCSYVNAILGPPTTFLRDYPHHAQLWLAKILSLITVQYFKQVEDVLKSVQKTEESLRRLKQIRERTTGESRSSGGDDEKIRQQLLIDVTAYCKAIEQLGLKTTDVEKLPELLNMVTIEVKPSK